MDNYTITCNKFNQIHDTDMRRFSNSSKNIGFMADPQSASAPIQDPKLKAFLTSTDTKYYMIYNYI